MAIEVGSAYVSIIPSFSNFGSQVQSGIAGHGTRAGQQLGNEMGGGALNAVRGLGGKLFAAAGIVAGFSFLKGLVDDARESAKVASITENAIRSTGGAAKISASQVGDLATAISNKTGADDEAVQSGQNLLLTFTNVQNRVGQGNDIFNQASQTLVDMTAAMNNGNVSSDSMKATSIQLGKALNDPVKGITALTKVGVTFTDQQKDQIKHMVAAGDAAGAQKVILGELNKEFGGTAAAASNPMQRLGVIIGNLREQLGAYLLPLVDQFASFIGDRLIPGMSALADQYGPTVAAVFGRIGDGLKLAWQFAQPIVGGLVGGIKDFVATLSGGNASPAWLTVLGSVKGIASDIMGSLSGVAGLIKDVFAGAAGSGEFASGFDKVKTAIGGYIDSVKEVYAKVAPIVRQIVDTVTSKFNEVLPKLRPIFKTIIDIVGSVFEVMKIVVKVGLGLILWAWNTFGKNLLGFIVGAFSPIVSIIGGVFNVIKGIFDVVIGVLTGNWSRAWNGVKEIFSGVWDVIVGALNIGISAIQTAIAAVVNIFKWLWDVLFGHSIITDMVAAFGVAWGLIQAGWNLLVTGFQILWDTILKPVFDAIAAVASWLWNNVLSVVFAVIKAEWNALVAILSWAWDTIGKPVFDAIATVASWLWNTVLSVVFSVIKTEWNALVAVLGWAWDNIGKPIFDGIAAVASWLWNNVLSPTWDNIKAGWNALIDGIKSLWNDVLKPVFDTVASVVETVADKVGKAFDGVGKFFKDAWNGAVDAVKDGWNTIANWVNKHVIEKVGDLFGITLPVLMTFSEGGVVDATSAKKNFATGGHVMGPGTSTSDSIVARLSDGEFVLQAAAVKAIGLDKLNALNQAHRIRFTSGDASGLSFALPGFADGGKVGKVKDWIRAQAGKPYVMGAVGPGAYDCSGLVGAVWALLNDKDPNRRYFSTVNESAFFKPGLGGPHAFNVGYFGGGGASGHTAGYLDGLNFEATPPRALVGSTNYRPESSIFTSKGHIDVAGNQTVWGWLYDHTVGEVKAALSGAMAGLTSAGGSGVTGQILRGITQTAVKALAFDGGGLLPQGDWFVRHNPTEPDRVLNAAQWKVAERAMNQATSGRPVEIHVHPRAEQSESEVAAMVSRELAWALRGE